MTTKEDIIKASTWRRAIKKYNGKQISLEDWDFLLEVARLAPTSLGMEAWHILDIENPELRQKIADLSWGAHDKMPGLSKFIVITVKRDIFKNDDYLTEMSARQGFQPEQMPTRLTKIHDFAEHDFELTDERRVVDWLSKQAYIVLAQMMMAASLINIDSTPIEGFHMKKLTQLLADKGALNPETDAVAVCAAFGYRDGDSKHPKTRREMREVVKVI